MAGQLGLCELSDDLLQLVAANLPLASLCHLGRVNRRLQKFRQGERAAMARDFSSASLGHPAPAQAGLTGTGREPSRRSTGRLCSLELRVGDTMVDWGKLMWEASSDDEWVLGLMPRVVLSN